MRYLIGLGAVVCIVAVLYLINTQPNVEEGSQVNSLATLPDNITTLPKVSPLPQPPDNSTITLSLPLKAVVDVAKQDEMLDADDMSFVYDDSLPQNVGEALDVDDMSFVYVDSPPQNVGEALDADDMSFVFDDSPPQNVGAALDVDDMSFVYDDSQPQRAGKALDADVQ
jgi:hypothetical protein